MKKNLVLITILVCFIAIMLSACENEPAQILEEGQVNVFLITDAGTEEFTNVKISFKDGNVDLNKLEGIFVGYNIDSISISNKNQIDLNASTYSEGINVYVKVSPKKYTISIVGDEVITYEFEYKSSINLQDLIKNDYIFDGYYFEEDFVTEFKEDFMPSHNVVLYPKFHHVPVNIVYYLENTKIGEEQVAYLDYASEYKNYQLDRIGYTYHWEVNGVDFNIKDTKIENDIRIDCVYEFAFYDMPVIYVDTNNIPIETKEEYVQASVSIMNAGNYDVEELTAGIRLRGNSTIGEDKKPYRIKFDKKQNILGLNNGNKFKSWVLLADYYDTSLMRNWTSFNVSKIFDFYSSDCAHVELYLNGEYLGVYLLAEQQQIDKNRINIEEYKEGESDSLNTGYLLEQDFAWRVEAPSISCRVNGNTFAFSIKSDTTENNQITYIGEYVSFALNALFEDNCERLAVEQYFDIDNAVEMCLCALITSDGDPNSSFYMAKDKDGKLMFVAPWDDDWAYGNDRGFADYQRIIMNSILGRFLELDWFKALVKAKWNLVKDSVNACLGSIDLEMNNYLECYVRNFEKWDLIGKQFLYQPEVVLDFEEYLDSYNYFKNWFANRLDFLDDYISNF